MTEALGAQDPDQDGQSKAGHERDGFSSAHELQDLVHSTNPETHDADTLERVRKNTRFHFVFVDHAPDMGAKAAAAVPKSAVLAIEAIGHSPEARAEAIAEYNKKLAQPPEEIEPFSLPGAPWLEGLLNGVIGKVDQVRFVDFDDNHTEIVLGDEAYDEAKSQFKTLFDNYAPNAEVEAALSHAQTLGGKSNKSREALVPKQLIDIAAELPVADQPNDITAIIGAVHTGGQHNLHRRNFQTDRVFVGRGEQMGSTKIEYSYPEKGRREVGLGGSEAPKTETIMRTHLMYLYNQARIDDHGLTAYMKDPELTQVLDQVNEAKQLPPDDRAARIAKILQENITRLEDEMVQASERRNQI